MKILVVDDELEYGVVMKKILQKKGYLVDIALSGEEAINIIKKDKNYDLILSDVMMKNMDGVQLLDRIKSINRDIEVILVTGYGSIENAVDAMKRGALSYFIKSNPIENLLEEVEKVKASKISVSVQKNNLEFTLKSKNRDFNNIIKIAKKAACKDVNILILGESGVGKDILARYIHSISPRKNEIFVPVNCCSFSENLLESELFGHEKGSFTGAVDSRKGRFELSNKGTLFLDEIGDIPLNVQVKLLRTLEDKSIERIGSNKSIKVDFRLICVMNKEPKVEISNGNIREDFFYRISTITITIPPLRKRREDLTTLIEFFLNKYQIEHDKKIHSIDKEVKDFLLNYNYPGNIRELKNIINRLVVLSEEGNLSKDNLNLISNNVYIDDKISIRPLREIRKEFECEYIEKVLSLCGNNISNTAKKLEISRRQLTNKISEYNIK
ncbi:TPA: sigma-54-dependent transcriptional regulator [Clostridioides difficile]|uniref:sigma-54-dependent transcriptional regulator n=1 Tax=Clostridioides difficile TaxID=1496 RepID=UPI00098011F4|nr:sigma-54 dependent transcriptional regulator [Clostridioides difficile]AXU27767.1 two-component response regulator [Clostridioides difficile]AXU31564.1 two-component response regulator [Clostridioides difficile]AXU35352.1 two-component response regulator [Clostridioides difficile]MCP8411006.1 sigma-54 dependent transcriptional regulator [Clostridioides difficile]MDC9388650.1 sigma-54 dependent transcriptional regulator [Clostridioides difficile]